MSGQELALLVHRLIDLKPDLVIAYDGGNDLFEPWGYDPRPGYPFNYLVEEEAMDTLASKAGDAKTIASLLRDSALVQAILGISSWWDRVSIRLAKLRGEVNYGGASWKQAVMNAYVRNIRAMCRVARSNGELFAAFFQPMLAYSKTLDSAQLAASGGDDMVRSMREQRNMVASILAAEFSAPSVEPGCRFDDLSGLLEDRPAAFGDLIHVDAEANEAIGRRIADELLAWSAFRSNGAAR